MGKAHSGDGDYTRGLLDDGPRSSNPEAGEGNSSSQSQSQSRSQSREGQLVESATIYENKPWKFKILALVCSCLMVIGSHYAAQMLSSLKSELIEELGITNTQYGLLQSAVSLVNTISPFFGGIFIDAFGTGAGSILACSLILVGDIIVAASTHMASFPVMIVGRVVYGVGAGSIVTVQESILAYWFKGKGLPIALGIQIACARLSGFLAAGTVVPIAENLDFYGYGDPLSQTFHTATS